MINQNANRKKALAAVALISILWGTTWLPSKIAVSEYAIPPMQLSGIRQFTAGILFLIFFLSKKNKLPTAKQFLKLLVLSIFFLVISNGLTLWALSYKEMDSGIASVVGATMPLWIALLSIFILRKHKITFEIFIGLLLGFGGIVIIFSDNLQALTKAKFQIPILMLFIATISWSIGSLLNAKKDIALNPFYSLGWQMFLSGSILLICSFAFEPFVPITQIKWQVWGCISYLIVIGSIITFVAFIYALSHLPAAQVAIYAYINPFIALLLGFIWRHEKLDWIIAAGAFVTLAGVYLVNNGFSKKPLQEKEVNA